MGLNYEFNDQITLQRGNIPYNTHTSLVWVCDTLHLCKLMAKQELNDDSSETAVTLLKIVIDYEKFITSNQQLNDAIDRENNRENNEEYT